MFGYFHVLFIILLKTMVGLIKGLLDALSLLCVNLVTPFVAGGGMVVLYWQIRQRGWSHIKTAMIMQRFLRQKHHRVYQQNLTEAREFIQESERQQRHNQLRKMWGLSTKNSLDLAH